MNVRTLIALRGSIEKWEKIVDGSGTDEGTRNCPLCVEFNTEDNKCEGCPVKESTGRGFCSGTPFEKWDYLIGQRGDYSKPRGLNSLSGELREEAKKVAQEEVDFLKSLLPPTREDGCGT